MMETKTTADGKSEAIPTYAELEFNHTVNVTLLTRRFLSGRQIKAAR